MIAAVVLPVLFAGAAGIGGYLLGTRGAAAERSEFDERIAKLEARLTRRGGILWACQGTGRTSVLVKATTEDGATWQAENVLASLPSTTDAVVHRAFPVEDEVLPLVVDLHLDPDHAEP